MWIIGIGVLVIVGALFFVLPNSKVNGYTSLNNFKEDITIYKSLSCGCCGIYADYFENKGNVDVKIVDVGGDTSIKTKYGVPEELQSCHTTIIGDYFVEGHVPLEAINKMLEEKPNIAGIAMSGMSGMPAGSPGMPGTKEEAFVIYAVNHDGSYNEFMRI